MFIAIAAAAVYQNGIFPGQKQCAGALSHIYGHRGQLSAAVFRCAQIDAQHQSQKRQYRRYGVLSGPVMGQHAQNKQSICEHQPPDQKRICICVERMIGDGICQLHHQQKYFTESPAYIPQNTGRRQKDEAQQHRQKTYHKVSRCQRNTYQAGQGCHGGEYAEVVGRQGHGEDHGA